MTERIVVTKEDDATHQIIVGFDPNTGPVMGPAEKVVEGPKVVPVDVQRVVTNRAENKKTINPRWISQEMAAQALGPDYMVNTAARLAAKPEANEFDQ